MVAAPLFMAAACRASRPCRRRGQHWARPRRAGRARASGGVRTRPVAAPFVRMAAPQVAHTGRGKGASHGGRQPFSSGAGGRGRRCCKSRRIGQEQHGSMGA
jgi:hypothetical protein